MNREPVAWTDIPLINGATASNPSRYRKAYGLVHLQGWIVASLSVDAFILPIGYRPNQTITALLDAASNSTQNVPLALARIGADGTFRFIAASDPTLFAERGASITCSFSVAP